MGHPDTPVPTPIPEQEIALDLESCDNKAEVKMPSRQREWQQRMHLEGRCIICGDAAVVACYCEAHRDQRMRKIRERRGDDYQPQQCSVCGEAGHNRRTCPVADDAPLEKVS